MFFYVIQVHLKRRRTPILLQVIKGEIALGKHHHTSTLFATGPGRAESTRPYRHCLLLYFDFCFNGVTQFLTKKEFEIFWGNSPLGPLNFSEFQFFRSDPKWTPITQHFCGRVTKYYLSKDVCKILELKILKFGKMAAIVAKINFLRFFYNLISDVLQKFWVLF